MIEPWVIKYSPKSVKDMVLTDDLKNMFLDFINNKTLNNITLYGIAGCGKTTLAKLLPKELDYYVKIQSCSADGSIDMIKTSVQDYCQVMTEPGKLKIIILDEADQISQQGQMALRNIIVDSLPDTRFILTCNYLDKIIPAIQSRCTPIKLDFSIKDVVKHIINILKAENIEFTAETLQNFVNNVIKKQYPDIRSIIERLQLTCQNGVLSDISGINYLTDNEVIKFIHSEEDPRKIREYLLTNEEKFSGDYIKLAGELFNFYKDDVKKMLLIADYLYKMTVVFDKEIQFHAMILQLKRI